GNRNYEATSTRAGHLGTRTLVCEAADLLWRRGALARGHRTLRRPGIFGRATYQRDRHSHGPRCANGERAAPGSLARNEIGVARTDSGRVGCICIEAPVCEPVFRSGRVAASDGRVALRRDGY